MMFRSDKRIPLLTCFLIITLFQITMATNAPGQIRRETRDTIMPCGDDAVRKVLQEKNPDFDQQLQEHELEVQKKIAEKQKADSLAQKKSAKYTKKKKKRKKIRR